jgi:hypothetical protein
MENDGLTMEFFYGAFSPIKKIPQKFNNNKKRRFSKQPNFPLS